LLSYTINLVFFEEWVHKGGSSNVAAGFFACLTVLLLVHRIPLIVENVKTLSNARSALEFLLNPWQLLDICFVLTALIGVLSRMVLWKETDHSRELLSVATIFVWFKVLYYLRPFKASGPLVSMVIAIAADIRVFCLIVLTSLIGFTQSFWLLSRHDDSLPFGTLWSALLESFNYMMGNFSVDIEGSVNPPLSTTLVVVFICFMIILMLNLLIALMGNTFAYVSGKGLAQWRQDQISIIMDEKFMLGASLIVPPYLFVMMYTIDFEEYEDSYQRRSKSSHITSSSSSTTRHTDDGGGVREDGDEHRVEHTSSKVNKFSSSSSSGSRGNLRGYGYGYDDNDSNNSSNNKELLRRIESMEDKILALTETLGTVLNKKEGLRR